MRFYFLFLFLLILLALSFPLYAYNVKAVYADYQKSLETIVRPMEKLQDESYKRLEKRLESDSGDENTLIRGMLEEEIIPYFTKLNNILVKGAAGLKTKEVRALYAPLIRHRALLKEISESLAAPELSPEEWKELDSKAKESSFWESEGWAGEEAFFKTLDQKMRAASMDEKRIREIQRLSLPEEGGGLMLFIGLLLERRA